MKAKTVAGLLLVALGVAALAFRTVTYTKKTHSAKVAGLELSYREKGTFEVPVWAGVAAVAAGTVLLVSARRR